MLESTTGEISIFQFGAKCSFNLSVSSCRALSACINLSLHDNLFGIHQYFSHTADTSSQKISSLFISPGCSLSQPGVCPSSVHTQHPGRVTSCDAKLSSDAQGPKNTFSQAFIAKEASTKPCCKMIHFAIRIG